MAEWASASIADAGRHRWTGTRSCTRALWATLVSMTRRASPSALCTFVRSEEVRLRTLEQLAIDKRVDLLVVEGDHAGDGQELGVGKSYAQAKSLCMTSPDRTDQ